MAETPSIVLLTRAAAQLLLTDADVLRALKASGPGWQTRINGLLRDAERRGRA